MDLWDGPGNCRGDFMFPRFLRDTCLSRNRNMMHSPGSISGSTRMGLLSRINPDSLPLLFRVVPGKFTPWFLIAFFFE